MILAVSFSHKKCFSLVVFLPLSRRLLHATKIAAFSRECFKRGLAAVVVGCVHATLFDHFSSSSSCILMVVFCLRLLSGVSNFLLFSVFGCHCFTVSHSLTIAPLNHPPFIAHTHTHTFFPFFVLAATRRRRCCCRARDSAFRPATRARTWTMRSSRSRRSPICATFATASTSTARDARR